MNGAAVSSAPKEERKGVKSPTGDAKVPQVFLWRSGCGALKIFWRLAAVFALLAVALASPAEAKAHQSGWARMAFREGHPCPSTGATWGLVRASSSITASRFARAGADAPINMRWQARPESLVKDGCSARFAAR